MKLVRFGAVGKEKPGVIDADGVIRDLSGVIGDLGSASLTTKALARLRKLNLAKLPKVSSRVRLGSCVPQPGNFIAIGLNYADHAASSASRNFVTKPCGICGSCVPKMPQTGARSFAKSSGDVSGLP